MAPGAWWVSVGVRSPPGVAQAAWVPWGPVGPDPSSVVVPQSSDCGLQGTSVVRAAWACPQSQGEPALRLALLR